MDRLRVTGEVRDGPITELSFVLQREEQAIPAVLWRPSGAAASSLTLLGHGGSGHKRSERQVRLATWFAAEAGIASLAIDGPFHGDRAADGAGPLDYQERVAHDGAVHVHDRMRRDWLDALAAVDGSGWVDGRDVAFLGMSMGARYGLPVCACLAGRLRCVVIGKFGLSQAGGLPDHLAANETITAAAMSIRAPVLHHVQWHDEIFPRSGQLDLFELFPSPDKQLRVRTGRHALTRPDDELAWREYVIAHLGRA